MIHSTVYLNESIRKEPAFGPVIITNEGDHLTTVSRIRKNTTNNGESITDCTF